MPTASRLRLLTRALRYRYRRDRDRIEAVLRRLRPGDVALDVGAHKGAWLYWLRRAVGPEGHVYAFEPQRAAADELRPLFRNSNNVTLERLALSDHTADARLYVPPGRGGISPSASLEPDRPDEPEPEHIELCPTRRLDEWAREVGLTRLDFVKCDVEGHELAVLRGGQASLEHYRPALLLECEQRHLSGHTVDDVFDFLRDLGYRGWFFHRGRERPIEQFDVEHHQRVEDLAAKRRADYCNDFLFE
jgi:FkbM family methyltransferase